jgi:hypothetical protein
VGRAGTAPFFATSGLLKVTQPKLHAFRFETGRATYTSSAGKPRKAYSTAGELSMPCLAGSAGFWLWVTNQ